MPRPSVFVTRSIPEAGLRKVLEACDAEVWPEETPPSRVELLRAVRGRDGILSLLTDAIDAEVMDAAPQLQVISNCAVGVDNVDLAAATRRKIPVGNTPGVLTDATADLTFALLLAAARHVVAGRDYVRAGKWRTWSLQLLLGADLKDKVLGIVGFGRIGRAVANRAKGFGLRVIYHDPVPAPESDATHVSLEELFRESDFISLHVPLTDATRHMINAGSLALMKPTTVLINTSRGGIVDHEALSQALKERRLFAAGLDVTEPEPINMDSPLLSLENCIVLPHLGSASKWTRDQMALLAAENLVAGLEGRRLPHCANPEVYESAE